MFSLATIMKIWESWFYKLRANPVFSRKNCPLTSVPQLEPLSQPNQLIYCTIMQIRRGALFIRSGFKNK